MDNAVVNSFLARRQIVGSFPPDVSATCLWNTAGIPSTTSESMGNQKQKAKDLFSHHK